MEMLTSGEKDYCMFRGTDEGISEVGEDLRRSDHSYRNSYCCGTLADGDLLLYRVMENVTVTVTVTGRRCSDPGFKFQTLLRW